MCVPQWPREMPSLLCLDRGRAEANGKGTVASTEAPGPCPAAVRGNGREKQKTMKRCHGALEWASFQSATSTLGREDSRCGVYGGEAEKKWCEEKNGLFAAVQAKLNLQFFVLIGHAKPEGVSSPCTRSLRENGLQVYNDFHALNNSISQVFSLVTFIYLVLYAAISFLIINARQQTLATALGILPSKRRICACVAKTHHWI